jgi:hypothetical protein
MFHINLGKNGTARSGYSKIKPASTGERDTNGRALCQRPPGENLWPSTSRTLTEISNAQACHTASQGRDAQTVCLGGTGENQGGRRRENQGVGADTFCDLQVADT